LELHTLGRKPRSQQFNKEISEIIRRQWPGWLNSPAAIVTADDVTNFAKRVAHYCPSRWNAIVSALQFITPAARSLRRRPLRPKERSLLSQLEFSNLVEELDRRPRSHAGLVIRFLAHTGLRINEARQLRWQHVCEDCFRLPGSITKNGKGRVIPFVNGVRETLERLRKVNDGEWVLPQAECQTSLRAACRRLKLPRLSHHDFRHLFATRCIQSGVDLPTVARWLGHSDGGALLARTYYHLVDEHSRRMAEKVVV
jgi:integrase